MMKLAGKSVNYEFIMEKIIKPYLLTEEMFGYEPEEDRQQCDTSGSTRRKLFGVANYSEYELDQISSVRTSYPDLECYSDETILRYLSSSNYDQRKALKALKTAEDWRNTRGDLYEKCKDMIQTGSIKLCGRDKDFRPIIRFHLGHFDYVNFAANEYIYLLCFVVESALNHLLVPGKIEDFTIIIDINHQGLSTIPFKQFKDMVTVLQNSYPTRMFKTFVLNVPSSLLFLWKVVRTVLGDETASKIEVINDDIEGQLLKYINQDQLDIVFDKVVEVTYENEKKGNTQIPSLYEHGPPSMHYNEMNAPGKKSTKSRKENCLFCCY